MTIDELKGKFKPFVYPYIGSSFMTGDESPEVIEMCSNKCRDISIQFAIDILEKISTADPSIQSLVIVGKIQELKSKLK